VLLSLHKKPGMATYKFRVLIDTESKEDVFRDINISANSSFEDFYHTIIHAFEFSGEQLGSFYLSNEDWDKGHEFVLMDMGLTDESDAPSVMAETKLNAYIKKEGQRLIMVYDFLRMWCFLIELIEINSTKISGPEIVIAIGDAPDELERDPDGNGSFDIGSSADLGKDIDDIFSEFDEDDEDFEDFENIDDFDF
jgi:hypothetical protein